MVKLLVPFVALIAIIFGFAWWGVPLGILLVALVAGIISSVCTAVYAVTLNSFCKLFVHLWWYYPFIPFLPWMLPSSFVENQKILSLLASLDWNWLYAWASLSIGAIANNAIFPFASELFSLVLKHEDDE